MGKIVKNYIYNSIYQIIAIIIPIITSPYLTRVLGAGNLGVEGYVTSVCQIFYTIGMIGLTNYATREIAYVRNDHYQRSKIFWEMIFSRITVFSLTLVVYLLTVANSPYRIYFLINIIWLFAMFFDVSWFFAGMEIFGITVARNLVVRIVTIISIFVFVKDENDLFIYILLCAVSQLIGTISIVPQLKRYISFIGFKNLKILKHFVPSLRVFFPQLASMLYLQMDKVMIEKLADAESVAYYNQAEKLIKAPLALITAASTVMMPRIANEFIQKNMEKVKAYLDNSLKFLMMMAFPVAFGMAGIANELIPWFLGEDFQPAALAMVVLSPIIVAIAGTSLSADQYFLPTNQTRILAISYTISALINLVVNFILIPKYSFVGAAIGTIAAEYSVFIIQYYVLNKQLKIIKPLLGCLKYGVFSVIMYIIITLLGQCLGAHWTTTILQIAVGVGVYVLLLLISRDKFFLYYTKKFLKRK